jgi:O-antigen ligase
VNATSAKIRTIVPAAVAVLVVAAAAVAWGIKTGAALEAAFLLVAGLAAVSVASGAAARRPWQLAVLFWAALSLPVVKHLTPGGGLAGINADHVIVYPVDVVLALGLASVVVAAVRREPEARKGLAALGRAFGAVFKPDLISWAIFASAAAVVLSTYNAPRPLLSFVALLDVGRLYATYVVFRRLAAGGPRPVLVGLVAAAAAHAGLCLLEFAAQNHFGLWEKPGWGAFIFSGATPEASGLLLARGGGTYEPNVTAQFLQMALPFAAAYFLVAAGRGRRVGYLALLVGVAAAMLVTFSRGGWLGGALAFAVVVVFAWWNKRRLAAARWALALTTALGVGVLIPAVAVVLARGVEGDQLSAVSRLADWRTAGAMIRDHPLLGVGKGNYLDLARLYNPWALAYPVHNVFLLTLAETGVAGLAAFIALLVGAFRAAARLLRAGGPHDAAFGLASLAAFAGIVLRMFVSMSFVHPFVCLTFVALAASAASAAGSPRR